MKRYNMKRARKTAKGVLITIACIATAALVLIIALVVTLSISHQQRENASIGTQPAASQGGDPSPGPTSEAEDALAQTEDDGEAPNAGNGDPLVDEPPLSTDTGKGRSDDATTDQATDQATDPAADQATDTKPGSATDPALNPGQTPPDPGLQTPVNPPVLDDSLQAAIDNISKKHGAVGVQVAVINNGEIAGLYLYGYAIKDTMPMAADTKIRVASLSKVILAMEIMKLSELGQIDIDADIGEYWGFEIRNQNHKGTPITMRQILSHTSSIRLYDYGLASGGELIRSRFKDGSCFGGSAPGAMSAWNYNNYAFAALGVTVEVATGKTVNTLAKQHLFSPLGIDAAFGSGSIADTDNLATLYTYGGGIGRSADRQKSAMGSTYPGEDGEEFPGGLTISAQDLAKLIAVLINKGEYRRTRILSPESVTQMQFPQGRTGGFEQCLAIRRLTNHFGQDELFYHTGSNYGVFTLLSYNPTNGKGVVVLTSGADGTRDAIGIPIICAEISEHFYKHYAPVFDT